jgi:hypothetical protein
LQHFIQEVAEVEQLVELEDLVVAELVAPVGLMEQMEVMHLQTQVEAVVVIATLVALV